MEQPDKPDDPVTETTNTGGGINSGSSLFPMLIGSLVLIIVGAIIVMMFV